VPTTTPAPVESPWRRFAAEFAESRLALLGLAMLIAIIALALAAPWVSPQNPYDLAQLDVMDSKLAPGERSVDHRQALLARHRRPGPRHALGDLLRHPHLALRRA
jgi:peptide/nickel transport system permease protein